MLGVATVLQGKPVCAVEALEDRTGLVARGPGSDIVANDARIARFAVLIYPASACTDVPRTASTESDGTSGCERGELGPALLIREPGLGNRAAGGIVSHLTVGVGAGVAAAQVALLCRGQRSPQNEY